MQYIASDIVNNEVDSGYPNYVLVPIPGYSGWFASSDGHIVHGRTGKVLSERDNRGRKQVTIGKVTVAVHNLVIKAYYGRPPCRGFFVRWRNGDKSDNRPENLMWAGRPRNN